MKCQCKDCRKKIEVGLYCSYECAMYDGAFSMKDGWNEKKVKDIKKKLNMTLGKNER